MTAPPPLPSITGLTPAVQKALTKKQKKALAFRDKSSKTKTKPKTVDSSLAELANEDAFFTQMAVTPVTLMEKPNRTRHKNDQVEVGGLEKEGTKGSRRRGEETRKGKERAFVGMEEAREQRGDSKKRQQVLIGQGTQSGKSHNQGGKRKRGQLDEGLDEGREQGVKERKIKRWKGEEDELGLGQDKERQGEEEGDTEEEVSEKGTKVKKVGKEKEKQRFILFIGNLKFTTTVEIIKIHFSACDPPPDVRLLTPKTSSTGKTTAKSKGCAFLEFSNRSSLQQALQLHHSMLEGRMINVELTAGGGGKGETRMEKVRERNKALLGQRTKRAEKTESRDGSLPSRPGRPQRYSTTSGIDQSSLPAKRTWSVGQVAEDEVHRGGKKHKKSDRSQGSRKSRLKAWGTGVNAIPVS